MKPNDQVDFSDRGRDIPHRRAWNIVLRTAHLVATGVLLGGHVFGLAEARLRLALYLSIATRLGLAVIEAYPSPRWFTQEQAGNDFPTWVRSGRVPRVVLDPCLLSTAVARTGAVCRFAPSAESERTGRVRPVAPRKGVTNQDVILCLFLRGEARWC
jgi:hypothetical protein